VHVFIKRYLFPGSIKSSHPTTLDSGNAPTKRLSSDRSDTRSNREPASQLLHLISREDEGPAVQGFMERMKIETGFKSKRFKVLHDDGNKTFTTTTLIVNDRTGHDRYKNQDKDCVPSFQPLLPWSYFLVLIYSTEKIHRLKDQSAKSFLANEEMGAFVNPRIVRPKMGPPSHCFSKVYMIDTLPIRMLILTGHVRSSKCILRRHFMNIAVRETYR